MGHDLELGVNTLFRDAVMESTVLELRTEDDWKAFTGIKDKSTRREAELSAHFENHRPELVEKARKALLRQAGSLTHDLPAPHGIDRFDKSNLIRRAERMVDQAHQTELLVLSQDEADAYSKLRDSIRAREDSRGLSREAFSRATDRRSGKDRRGPTRDR